MTSPWVDKLCAICPKALANYLTVGPSVDAERQSWLPGAWGAILQHHTLFQTDFWNKQKGDRAVKAVNHIRIQPGWCQQFCFYPKPHGYLFTFSFVCQLLSLVAPPQHPRSHQAPAAHKSKSKVKGGLFILPLSKYFTIVQETNLLKTCWYVKYPRNTLK